MDNLVVIHIGKCGGSTVVTELRSNNINFENRHVRKVKYEVNKTYVIISHKLKPLKICDEIIILEKGKISEQFNYSDFYEKYHLLYD